MITVPAVLFARYQAHLKAENLSVHKAFEYQNWLRYLLDFCDKYQIAGSPSARLYQFIAKLRDKGRTEEKRQQAAHARVKTRWQWTCLSMNRKNWGIQ